MGGVLLPTTPSQRAPLYADTETLITVGFLTHTLTVNGVRLALRSLCPGDLFLLRARIGNGTDTDWRVWSLAQSVWLLDGYTLLGEVNVTPRVARAISSLPKRAQDILFSVMMGLFSRQSRALDAVEAYSYEVESRFRWKAFSGQLPGHRTGIPGAEHLGMNYVQQMWAFYNQIEDQRLRDEAMWEGFKLSTSPHAPKGVQKIDNRDQQSRKNEQERRRAVQDRFYYETLGLLKKREKGNDQSRLLTSHKTVEDLEEEMRKWVTGEEDDHDRVVKETKRRIMARYEAEKQLREKRALELRQRQEQMESEETPTKIVAYTPDQLNAILRERQPGPPGARTLQEAPPQRDYVYARWLGREEVPGALREVDGVLQASVNPDPNVDLMGLISERRVGFSSESEE